MADSSKRQTLIPINIVFYVQSHFKFLETFQNKKLRNKMYINWNIRNGDLHKNLLKSTITKEIKCFASKHDFIIK